MSSEIEQLAERIKALSAAELLRLAAGMLDAGNWRLAEQVTERALAKIAIQRLREPGGRTETP